MAMLIGKRVPARSSICTADAASITIRDRDLCGDLMGRLSFSEFFYFLVTGHEPSEDQRFFLDLLLVAIAEHGLTPTAQATRMTYDADPQSLQAAVAAGILGCGTVVLGTAAECGELLAKAEQRVALGEDPKTVVTDIAHQTRREGKRLPGFGHPLHHPVDPRAKRVMELADRHNIVGSHLELARLFPTAVAEAWNKPLPMNVSMPTAAVLLDLEFPGAMIKAIPLLGRTGGLLAHIAEEQTNPIGFLMASSAEAAIEYVPNNTEGARDDV